MHYNYLIYLKYPNNYKSKLKVLHGKKETSKKRRNANQQNSKI